MAAVLRPEAIHLGYSRNSSAMTLEEVEHIKATKDPWPPGAVANGTFVVKREDSVKVLDNVVLPEGFKRR